MNAPLTRCPLCGESNGCAMAAGGSTDTPCWCCSASFSAELLSRVPEAQQGLVCVCARCAATSAVASVDQPAKG